MYSLGIDPDKRTDDAEFAVGAKGYTDDGRGWVYVKADGAIRANNMAVIDEDFKAKPITTSIDQPGIPCGQSTEAFADDDYGWMGRDGKFRAEVNGAVAAGGVAGATSETGRITDAGTPHLSGRLLPGRHQRQRHRGCGADVSVRQRGLGFKVRFHRGR